MEIEVGRIVLPIIATISVFIWIVFALKNNDKYSALIESVDSDEYPFPELFCVGFSIMALLNIDSKSKKARARVKEISEVKGRQYAEYHYYILNGAKWTYAMTLFTLFAILGAMAYSIPAIFAGLVFARIVMWYMDERFNDQLEDRRDELISDLPQMLSKMTLLVNSGMPVRDAWKRIADASDRALYSEMKQTVFEMQNGVLETEAYSNFADRCSIKEIRRFAATMNQSLQKGNSEIAMFLKDMADDMWEEKKHMVKRKGEAANSKLLIPTAMIFIGILLLIMVPAFSGL